ncbi:MAG TPA: hypothetical protein VHP54_01985 [Caproiciproducens sp.]|nr:hypothetical protein [Caproiciproducens sp.]
MFSATTPKTGGFYKSKLDFSTVITDEMSGVNASTISVKVNDKPVTDFSFNSESGKLSFSVDALQSGSKYRVIVRASDNKGNEAVPYIDNTYAVDFTPDTEGPVISEVTPTQNVTVQYQGLVSLLNSRMKKAKWMQAASRFSWTTKYSRNITIRRPGGVMQSRRKTSVTAHILLLLMRKIRTETQ